MADFSFPHEMRVSPDGAMIAIRSDNAEDAWNAWGVMHRTNGGHWATSDQVASWNPVATVTQYEPPAPPEGPGEGE